MNQEEKALLHNALTTAKKAIAKVVLHGPGYDWNGDPLALTLVTGNASQLIDEALPLVAPDLGSLSEEEKP